MLVYAVVGGDTVFFGPVLGAAFLTTLPEALRGAGQALGFAPGPLRLFVNGAILLAVILFLPNGLVSLPDALRTFRLRRMPRAPLG
jgi:branched-chain amino acid transport system permease protein